MTQHVTAPGHDPAGDSDRRSTTPLDASGAPPETDVAEMLDQRYGRPSARAARHRTVAVAVALGTVLAVWTGWAGWHASHPDVRAELVGYQVLDAAHVEVTLRVATSSGQRAVCELRASGPSGEVVGRTTVSVPDDGVRSRTLTAVVPTSSEAVNGELHACQAG